MTTLIGFVKAASIMSFLAGAMIGMEAHEWYKRGSSNTLLFLEDRVMFVCMLVFGLLTVAVFVIDFSRWGVSPSVMRFVWIMAFVFGAVAFPLMVLE